MSSIGLRRIPLPELAGLAARLQRGELRVPLDRTDLIAAGHGSSADDLLAALGGLDAAGVSAALGIAIAERDRAGAPRLDIVWTGPESRVSTSRDTAVMVREMFAAAEHTVFVAGFRFSHGSDIFAPLHHVMKTRGVTTDIILDCDPTSGARAARDLFLQTNWKFGAPLPRLHYDPRTATPGTNASMHAKCVIVDQRWTLITSANFTDRAQTRNIELGVVIEDADFGARVAAQWRGLLDTGLLQAI